jgi:hypothetical protein
MPQRGRKSPDSLLIAATAIPQRPEPPADLSPEEADIWRGYVTPMPADWFPSNTWQTLANLCALVAHCRLLRSELHWFREGIPKDPAGYERFRQIEKSLESKMLTIATLETKLRLTPQSKDDHHHRAEKARTAIANAATGPKPWD